MQAIHDSIWQVDKGLYCVDSHYVKTQTTAIYILENKGEIAIIDTAHNAAVKLILQALKKLNLDRVPTYGFKNWFENFTCVCEA